MITPSAMPQGAELSIGYLSDDADFGLISAGQPLTCRSASGLALLAVEMAA